MTGIVYPDTAAAIVLLDLLTIDRDKKLSLYFSTLTGEKVMCHWLNGCRLWN
jgi:hypothetical protein